MMHHPELVTGPRHPQGGQEVKSTLCLRSQELEINREQHQLPFYNVTLEIIFTQYSPEGISNFELLEVLSYARVNPYM